MAQKLKTIILSLSSLLFLGSVFLFAPTAQAITCPYGSTHPKDANGDAIIGKCDTIKKPINCSTGLVDPNDSTKCTTVGSGCDNKSAADCLSTNPIVKYLNVIVDVLSVAVGLVVIAMIIIGGIQYSMAGDNPSAVTAAKKRIANALLALLAYALTFSFLQWIVPGGVF